MAGRGGVDWVNYQHLLYFWVVAREGSIRRACEELHLAQPTISGQLRKLEKSLGVRLFRRVGRGLELTDDGQVVLRYANDIFALGRELSGALKGRATGRPLRFTVGVPDVLPKLVVYRLLEPALQLDEPMELICYEGKLEGLLAELAAHHLDLVLADAPVGPQSRVRAFNHPLGACGVTIYATPELQGKHTADFPQSLDGAPMLLPTSNTTLRRQLDQWFEANAMRPRIKGEFEDSGLLKAFGQTGLGMFPGPTAIEAEITRQYDVGVVGRIMDVREAYYAISVERRLKHPAILAIAKAARANFLA